MADYDVIPTPEHMERVSIVYVARLTMENLL